MTDKQDLPPWFTVTPEGLGIRTVLMARRTVSDTGYWLATADVYPVEVGPPHSLMEPKVVTDAEVLELAKLHDEVHNLYHMLQRLQWRPGEWEHRECPECCANEEDGHSEYCRLARLLDIFGTES